MIATVREFIVAAGRSIGGLVKRLSEGDEWYEIAVGVAIIMLIGLFAICAFILAAAWIVAFFMWLPWPF